MAEQVERGVLSAAPAALTAASAAPPGNAPADEGRTRGLVSRTLLESGPLTAAALAQRLKLSPAAVRRHLDALVADGSVRAVEPRPKVGGSRGRGRPARAYALTDAGRARFGHAYDDLASHAMHYLRETGGEAAVAAFADHRARNLVSRITAKLETDTESRADDVVALAAALTDEGYAASTEPSAQAGLGVQLCQHHCPVAHVAAEFPELCEAETRALAEVLGTYVQRLATIAHGDGVCTTYIPISQLSHSGRKQ
jgi:predicted ArsR family transcriptional regulator